MAIPALGRNRFFRLEFSLGVSVGAPSKRSLEPGGREEHAAPQRSSRTALQVDTEQDRDSRGLITHVHWVELEREARGGGHGAARRT